MGPCCLPILFDNQGNFWVLHVKYHFVKMKRFFTTTTDESFGPNTRAQGSVLFSTEHKTWKYKAEQIRQTINTRLTQKTTNIAANWETASLQSKLIFGEMPSSANRLEMLSSSSVSQRGWNVGRDAEHSSQPCGSDWSSTRAAGQFRAPKKEINKWKNTN